MPMPIYRASCFLQNIFAIELDGSCYVTQLLPAVTQRIQDPSKLKDFEVT